MEWLGQAGLFVAAAVIWVVLQIALRKAGVLT